MSENSLNTTNKFIKYRKDFVELLDDTREALILQEILYRLQEQDDYHSYLNEELNIDDYNNQNLQKLSEGWILLTAGFLKEVMYLPCSTRTISRAVQRLVEKGYLLEQDANNESAPKNAKEYRVCMQQLADDLNDIGYYFDVPEP